MDIILAAEAEMSLAQDLAVIGVFVICVVGMIVCLVGLFSILRARRRRRMYYDRRF